MDCFRPTYHTTHKPARSIASASFDDTQYTTQQYYFITLRSTRLIYIGFQPCDKSLLLNIAIMFRQFYQWQLLSEPFSSIYCFLASSGLSLFVLSACFKGSQRLRLGFEFPLLSLSHGKRRAPGANGFGVWLDGGPGTARRHQSSILVLFGPWPTGWRVVRFGCMIIWVMVLNIREWRWVEKQSAVSW